MPENAKVFFYRGEVWIEMGKQQIFTHVAVKTEIIRILAGITKIEKLGIYLSDGVLVTNEEAELSGNPDAVFVSRDSLTLTVGLLLLKGKKGALSNFWVVRTWCLKL